MTDSPARQGLSALAVKLDPVSRVAPTLGGVLRHLRLELWMTTDGRLTADARRVEMSDEQLMRDVQADDVRAFEEIYRRYSSRGLGLARVICRGSNRAEEATQDAFVSVWRHRASYDQDRGTVRAWLLMVIRNRSIDLMRQQGFADSKRCAGSELDYLPAPGSVVEEVEREYEAAQLRGSLQKLPISQREVIALAYFGGLSHAEIATRLELPVGTVKGRMRLALIKVRSDVIPSTAPEQAADRGHAVSST
jgi:RNA polymerase sigma-70 factor, ECF subfamily